MRTEAIQQSFKESVAKSVELFPEGEDRYKVFTPFHFDDGDHFVVVLKQAPNRNWVITDEGHTYMHMSYDEDLSSFSSGNRNEIIENALEKYGVKESDGKLFASIDEMTCAGNVLYNFIQCLIQITDVSYLSRERVVSTFKEDFKCFIEESVSEERVNFDYREEKNDPEGKYKVDCRINGMDRPLHVYAITGDDKCNVTTITILQHQSWNLPFFSLGVFEDQEQISRKALSRFTDVCDRQFSSLVNNKEKIKKFFEEQIK